jgi:hypothetical protein
LAADIEEHSQLARQDAPLGGSLRAGRQAAGQWVEGRLIQGDDIGRKGRQWWDEAGNQGASRASSRVVIWVSNVASPSVRSCASRL